MANKFDEKYEIRLACKNDIDTIMQFIDEHWSKGHIMATDRKLFEYEYVDGENVNFVLAIDKETQYIEAIFGFIRTSHTKDYDKKYIWGSMWKVNETHPNMSMLGTELAKRVCDLAKCKRHIGNGANPNTTIPIRRLFFKDKVGKMKQYYLLNPNIERYQIADIKSKETNLKFKVNYKFNIDNVVHFQSIEEVKQQFDLTTVDAIPYKDYWYIDKRFFKHPYYKYKVYGIKQEDGQVGALLMARVVSTHQGKVLRIMDYIGDQTLFEIVGHYLYQEMIENHYEYIDLYTWGFDEKSITKTGFKLRDEEDPNIIPNYFEPFLRKNIDIWVHYKDEGTLFFKADGDQDRPNLLKGETVK